jgi:uncharacterized cupredoxin-like copper-binding protein
VAAAAGAHGAHAFVAGQPGDPKKPSRTVEVIMKETSDGKALYGPEVIPVKRGEQIRFILKNIGEVDHVFIIDSVENNTRHKAAMAKNPAMSHNEPNGKRIQAGTSTELVWHFTKAGTFEVACSMPGHTELGMKGEVIVK